jgi:hypothetical protein
MKTITITINISEEIQQPLTIKSSIQEQINFHLNEKEKARESKIILQKGVISLRDKILKELNEKVGSEVWFSKHTKEGYYYNTLWFKDGIRRNTCYDDWNITISYDTKEIIFGQIKYEVPIVENGFKVVLEPTESNNKNWKDKSSTKSYIITDLDAVHKHLEKDYLTYFTNKL